MKFDLNLVTASVAEMPARARDAKAAGYDGIFVAETGQDPYVALAAAVEHTDGMDLGTSIALAFTRSPMTTAMTAWDLQRASGRFILGLGSQVKKHIERRFSCAYDPPVPRLKEYVAAVRHTWGAFQGHHALNFQGDYYKLDFLPDFVNPGPLEQAPPPIFLATVGPVMYQAAGQVADGAFVHPLHTVGYLRDVAHHAIAIGLEESERCREDFTLSATVFAIIGEGQVAQRMESQVRKQLAFYASTPTYRPVLEHAGWGDVGAELTELVRAGRHAEAPAVVPDAMVRAFSVVATEWEHAADLARERYEGVADRISFYNPPVPGQAILRSQLS